ncbi:MFS transporter [Streptomyces yaizuensis]|uniref:MHS family MFS transporter n=1 Tax=Streptomyces yaizuensis TaxID=2989713 RepID=A0ABQ5P2M8_9ACTN|nr:MFS transporter [Streptomyces sp. YSPA8]GLF96867.1 MHS family MFS transporter [Streptomyces sp. YSPA8]
MVGTTIQYFDFFIYALASVLIFPDVFFPGMSDAAATLTAFASIGVAFVMRPLGALIFGHFADRRGRTSVLVVSIALMGVSTFLVGILPGYATLGFLAPLALILLRMAQGIALGGEGMGATILAVEYAPPRKRGLYSAFPGVGASLGALLAHLSFLSLTALLGEDRFASWGWRIPFLAGAVLVVISLWIRLSVAESPVFAAVHARERALRVPLAEVLRRQPATLALAIAALLVGNVLYFVTQTFALSYGTTVLDVPDAVMLRAALISLAVQAVTGFLAAAFSDRLGRRRVCVTGAVLCGLWAVPLIWLLRTGEPALITVAFALSMLVYAVYSGPLGAYLAGLFTTRYRFTAVALAFNTGVMAGGALAPAAADRLIAATGSVWAVSGLVAGAALISLAALARLTERHPDDLGADG